MSLTSRWWRLLLVVVLLAAASMLAAAFAERLGYRPLDLQNYLAAANEAAGGRSPYRSVEFFALPWVAILLIPLTWAPPAYSAGIWLLVSLAAVLALALLWIDYAGSPAGRRERLLAGITAVLSPAALYGYVTGQITALAGLALVYLAYSTRPAKGLVWLIVPAALVAGAKPHIVGIPLALLLLDSLRSRNWRLPVYVAASVTVAGLIALLVLPDWPREWLGALGGGAYLGGSGLVAEGYLGLRELGIPGTVLALPLVYAVGYWFRHGTQPRSVALALASGLLWLPYTRVYDQVLLLPAAFIAAADWHSSRAGWMAALPLAAYAVMPLTDLSLILPAVLLALLLARSSILR